jgi:DNA-binding transcriptional LysR family regulator
MIDYRYEVFLAVASKLSFSKAAEELYVSQPSISKHIKILEDQSGVALFERKGNSISLTKSGEKLFAHLQRAKLIQKNILSDFTSTKHNLEVKGDLKIGASTTVSLYILPKILAAFHREFPKANVLLINRNSENVLKALHEHEVDLAFVENSMRVTSVRSSPFMFDNIIAVCSKNVSIKPTMEIETLKSSPLALRERGSGTLAALADNLKTLDIKLGDLNIIARLGGTEALKNYLIAGEAIGFLSRIAVEKELASGDLIELHIPGLNIRRDFYFVMRQGEESMGLSKSFVRMAKQSL